MDAGARGYEGFGGRVAEFASESEPWWPAAAHSAAHSAGRRPNVVVVLVDDLGFSDLGPFGSEIATPHIDRLAQGGWTYTNYHTAPMCSPSRAALLTGLNPHRAGFGFVAHVDPGYPGFSCELPADAPTLAESLRAGGYATFAVGKWHLTIESKLHDGADKSSWPIQRGFDRYYGAMDGFTSLHHPHRLVRDNSPVDVPEFPEGYFLTDDLTDQALAMIDELRSADADRPFLLYFAHTAVHGPIQAKADDIAAERGRYADGWDDARRRRFDRQRELGVVAADAVLPGDDLPDAAAVPRWDGLDEADRALFERHMEAYAAAVGEIDRSVGRILDRLDELGEREDTIVVVTSDNGGSAEGGAHGTRSYFAQFGSEGALPADWLTDVPRDPELIGGPRLFAQYPAGWGRVSNTPFRAFKGSAYEGGVHAPLVVSWPNAPLATDAHGLRRQFVFVSDLAPTILDLVGVEPLASRGPAPAPEVDGRSFADTLADPAAPARSEQYIEVVGRRALFADGLKAVSPVPPAPAQGAAGGEWELYDLGTDPTETADLAASRPRTVERLAERWRSEAWRNTVFPLNDDGSLFRVRPATEARLSDPVELTPHRPPLERFRSARLVVLRSFAVDMSIGSPADGVLLAHGDQGGGYLLAIEDGCLHLAYNAYGEMHRDRSAPLPARALAIRLTLDELPDLRWRCEVRVDGELAASVDDVPMLLGMAPFTGISVGYDYGSPVDWELHERHGAFRLPEGVLSSLRYVPGPRSPFDETVLKEIGDRVAAVAD